MSTLALAIGAITAWGILAFFVLALARSAGRADTARRHDLLHELRAARALVHAHARSTSSARRRAVGRV